MAKRTCVVREVAVGAIDIDDQALRHDPESDSIVELAGSIERDGLLQPVGVAEKEDGRYQLCWGGRRLAAHQRLRRERIEARIYALGDAPVKGIALVENLQREQLTLAEEVEAIKHLTEVSGLSVNEVSAALSKSRSWVLARLSVEGMQEEIREPLLAGDISLRVAEEISRHPDEGVQKYVLSRALQERLSASAVKQIVRLAIDNPTIEAAAEAGRAMARGEIKIAPVLLPCAVCERRIDVRMMRVVYVCSDQVSCEAGQAGRILCPTGEESTNGK